MRHSSETSPRSSCARAQRNRSAGYRLELGSPGGGELDLGRTVVVHQHAIEPRIGIREPRRVRELDPERERLLGAHGERETGPCREAISQRGVERERRGCEIVEDVVGEQADPPGGIRGEGQRVDGELRARQNLDLALKGHARRDPAVGGRLHLDRQSLDVRGLEHLDLDARDLVIVVSSGGPEARVFLEPAEERAERVAAASRERELAALFEAQQDFIGQEAFRAHQNGHVGPARDPQEDLILRALSALESGDLDHQAGALGPNRVAPEHPVEKDPTLGRAQEREQEQGGRPQEAQEKARARSLGVEDPRRRQRSRRSVGLRQDQLHESRIPARPALPCGVLELDRAHQKLVQLGMGALEKEGQARFVRQRTEGAQQVAPPEIEEERR